MDIAEFVDYKIEEKIAPLFNDLEEIKKWQSSVDTALENINEKVSDIKQAFNLLHEALLSKIKEYNLKIKDMEATSSAFAELFKKTSKLLAENLHKLEALSLP